MRRRPSAALADAAVALVPAALGIYQALALPQPEVGAHGRAGFAAAAVTAGALLLLRRRLPLFTVAAVVAAVSATPLLGIPLSNAGLFAVALACYSHACYRRGGPVWAGWAVATMTPVGRLASLPDQELLSYVGQLGPTIAIVLVYFALATYAGHVERQRRTVSAALAARALQVEQQAQPLADLDAVEERARIARDLQRIVLGAVTEVRSRAARAVAALPRTGREARAAIDEVADGGRAALTEMRRLLGVLRIDETDAPGGLDPAQLRREAAAQGIDISFDMALTLQELPAALGHVFRRFVEIGIATAATSSGRPRLDVVARTTSDRLELRATRGTGPEPAPPSGAAPWDPALAALHERVAVLGGELEVDWGPRGPELAATIPLDADVTLGDTRRSVPAPAGRAAIPQRFDAWRSAGSRSLVFDIAAALGIAVLGVLEILLRPPNPHLPVPEEVLPGVLLLVAFAATLFMRRRSPLTGFAIVLVLTLLIGLPFVRKSDAIQVVIAMYLFTIAARYGWRIVAFATAGALIAEIPHLARVSWTCLCVVLILAIVVAAVATGRVARRRDALNAVLRERLRDVARRRDEQAQAAVMEERRRMAREMHDVVAHRLSILVLQASAAGGVVARDRAQARSLLDEVAHSAEALSAELRELMGEVTEDDVDGADVADLVADARRVGLTVELFDEVTGDAAPSVRLAIYRIVQEALTNVRKHAPGADVTIRVHREDGDLRVEVENTPGSASDTADIRDTGGGHGLAGMRERVKVFDGELEAGPRADGGFSLRARLPEPSHA